MLAIVIATLVFLPAITFCKDDAVCAAFGSGTCPSNSQCVFNSRETKQGTAIGCFHGLRNAPTSTAPQERRKKIEDDVVAELKKCCSGAVISGDGLLDGFTSILGGLGGNAGKFGNLISTFGSLGGGGGGLGGLGDLFGGSSTANTKECRKQMENAICEETLKLFPNRGSTCSSVQWCDLYNMIYNKQDLLDFVAGPRPNVKPKFGQRPANLCTGSISNAALSNARISSAIRQGLAEMRRARSGQTAGLETTASQGAKRWFGGDESPRLFLSCSR